jgi:hypothetical protein
MKNRMMRMFRGGFNRAQLKVAFIVMEALGKNKIVLLPKAKEKRYDIVVDDHKNIKITNSKGFAKIKVSKGISVNIKNFHIYVGSTTDNELILINGNDENLKHLEQLYTIITEPEAALMLIQSASDESLITTDEAEELTEQIEEHRRLIGDSPEKLLLKSPSASSPKQSNIFMDVIKLILNVLHLFFLIILKHIKKKTPKSNSPKSPKSPKTPESPEAISDLVISDIRSPDSNYQEAFDKILEEISGFETYTDNGPEEEPTIKTPIEIKKWKCVTPYSRKNKNIRDRIKSCENSADAIPDSSFENDRYPNRQNCIDKCHK